MTTTTTRDETPLPGPPPGPTGKLRATISLVRSPLSYYRELFELHGDSVKVPALNGTIVLTATPEGAKQILSSPPDTFDPFGVDALENVIGPASMRLFPIIPDVIRILAKPMTLLGHRIPAGHGVGIATTVMHHDSEHYEDPMSFRPSRFVGERPPKWAYFPFGGGHRRCVGAAFASFELALMIAETLRTREITLEEPEPLEPVRRNLTMAPPTGVRARLRRR